MKYDVALQTQYPDTAYRTASGLPKGATIASGGCGPSSCRNLLNNLLCMHYTIPQVAQIAVDCGARYNGGTTIGTLLKSLQKRSGNFDYRCVTKDSEAFDAVRNGAMAIIHTPAGAAGNLFSSGGHFMCLAAVDGSMGTIIDSNSTAGKWTANAARRKYIKPTNQTGVIRCSTTMIAKAIDYYYIVEVDEMTEEKTKALVAKMLAEHDAKAAAAAAQPSPALQKEWKQAQELGITDGTSPQAGCTREQVAAMIIRAAK